MGLIDLEILEEIGDLYAVGGTNHSGADDRQLTLAIEAYTKLVAAHPHHGEGWQKLGDALTRRASDRNGAIMAFKKAIELVEGEGNRQKIALTL